MMTSNTIKGRDWTAVFRTGGSGITTSVRALKNQFMLAFRTPAGRIGLPIVLIHLTLALFGTWLAPYDATDFVGPQLDAPSWQFLMGTDVFGRDILSRVMSGAGSIIGISAAGALLGIALGTIVGMGSGYKGGKTDEVIMRIMDGLMSFPSLLMALLVLTIFASSEIGQRLPQEGWVILTIGIVFMPPISRVMRSTTLALKTQEFVQSARMRGEPAPYIIFREILPNTWSVLAVELSVRLSYAILLASSLGFLGLGVQPPSPDWGLMISESRRYIVAAPWVALAPAFAVASLIIGVNLLTDGIRQASRLPQKGTYP
ncbi:MAG: ABC transporter permease [Dehalococcoidales bacterium]|nr:MAG: ABC transporter permease [Dehalococcoidales bacterium]